MVVTMIVAAGAAWESAVLELLHARPAVVVLKRCVDVEELLAASTAGQAEVAVVALDAPGLDQAAMDVLRRNQVRVVAVAASRGLEAARTRASRLGITAVLGDDELDRVPDLVETDDVAADPLDLSEPEVAPSSAAGRIVTVWGPAGAPGRTTVATGLAAELARRSVPTTLVDADPYGGSVAQHLGVLDEMSGLLAAARLTATGGLEEGYAGVVRALDGPLQVVTGLPRPDRWSEVRAGAVEHLLEVARGRGQVVVVDTGFSLELDAAGDVSGRPSRNQLTHGALAVADEVVVVGAPDPVGLSRLARALVELREHVSAPPVRVVVNRMRASLGWSERDIVGMVEGFARLAGIHFVPDDRVTADRALTSGHSVVDVGDSALAQALARVADGLVPTSVPGRRRGGRRVGVVRRRRQSGAARSTTTPM